ncbi:hypothetical protein [uncultured Cohaesibacter sp.]|uniref:hypothetical protein n=1 Tax=uncultured Cohaesibacter sp. TaxID=1002546 RepID=UPI0037497474
MRATCPPDFPNGVDQLIKGCVRLFRLALLDQLKHPSEGLVNAKIRECLAPQDGVDCKA